MTGLTLTLHPKNNLNKKREIKEAKLSNEKKFQTHDGLPQMWVSF